MARDTLEDWPPQVLGTLTLVFETLVPLPEVDHARNARLAAETLTATVDPGELRLLRLALRGLEFAAFNLATTGVTGRFSRLDQARREDVLRRWSTHPVSRLRTAYQALKRIGLFLAYGDGGDTSDVPANLLWPRIGYRPDRTSPAAPLFATQPLGARDQLELEADVVVVGSGAGGGVVAARLSQAGLATVVLEAGPHRPEPEMPRSEATAFRDLYLDRGTTSSHDLGLMILAGAGLGGGTTVNWTTSIEPPAWLRDEWSTAHGLVGYDGPEVEADLVKLRDELGVTAPSLIPPKDRVILDGAAALGWEAAPTERNAGPCTHCGACGFGCRSGAKRSGLRAHLAAAAARGTRLVPEATVERVELQGGRAVGVSGWTAAEGGRLPFRVRAGAVVVAAGALRSPLILARSGIRHPQLGRNLHLHPTAALAVQLPQAVEGWLGPTQASRSLQFWRPGPAAAQGLGPPHGGFVIESAPAHPGLVAAALPWDGGVASLEEMGRARYRAPLIGIVRDRGAGRLRLTRRGWPRIDYRIDRRDGQTVRRALIEMARLGRAAGGVELIALATPGRRWEATRGAAAFESFCVSLAHISVSPNRVSLFSAHQMGTARSGADPRSSACDPFGRVRADTSGAVHHGLYVADAALFPTAAGVNPMLTVMTLAERTARAVLADRE